MVYTFNSDMSDGVMSGMKTLYGCEPNGNYSGYTY